MARVYLDLVGDEFDSRHLDLLRRARALGSELLVGVHGDDACEWFHRRPERPLPERIRAVEASGLADRVLPDAPIFPSATWLRAHSIGLVAHSDRMPERSLRYWYPAASELGILRTLEDGGAAGVVDLEGRLVAPPPAAAQEPPTLAARVRRRVLGWLPRTNRDLKRQALEESMQLLWDTLAATPLAGRVWIVGGLLLGWARQGRPLDSDLDDADLAYLDQDHERFLASIPALVAAGFAPRHRFSSADGRYLEHRFRRGRVQFDFFRMRPVGDRWSYSLFTTGAEPEELVAEVPAQPRVPFRFLGREWRKVADHDLALRSIYGDWRTDRPDWRFTDDRAVARRIPMAHLPYAWRWPGTISRGPGETGGGTRIRTGE